MRLLARVKFAPPTPKTHVTLTAIERTRAFIKQKLAEMVSYLAMASPSEEAICIHYSVIRGHHIYKQIWTPNIGEVIRVDKEPGNVHDKHAVALLTPDGVVIGHVPRELSSIFWHFLSHNGKITCEVTGKRKRGKGLEVPCAFKFLGAEKLVVKMKELLTGK